MAKTFLIYFKLYYLDALHINNRKNILITSLLSEDAYYTVIH